MTLPSRPNLRPNVAVCVVNPKNEVLLVWSRQHRKNDWMMPQGGIEPTESPSQAALRELKEELGIINAELLVLRERIYSYRWPTSLVKHKGEHAKDGYVGQEQSLAIVRVPIIRPKLTPDPREATRTKWVPLAKFLSSLSPVRRSLGKLVVVELERLPSFKLNSGLVAAKPRVKLRSNVV